MRFGWDLQQMSITGNPDPSSGISTLFKKGAGKWFYFGKALLGKDFILRTKIATDRTPNTTLRWENRRISKDTQEHPETWIKNGMG